MHETKLRKALQDLEDAATNFALAIPTRPDLQLRDSPQLRELIQALEQSRRVLHETKGE